MKNMRRSNDKVLELAKFLPHGYKKEIMKRAGVSYMTLAKFLNGGSVRYDKAKSIIIETTKFYKEVKDLETSVIKEMISDK